MTLFEITEKFSSNDNLRRHYISHVKVKRRSELPFGNVSIREYETLADNLQRAPVDNINIFGYEVEKEGKRSYNKFDRRNNLFVAYFYRGNEPLTITCYKMDFNKFMRRSKYKIGDIPKGK